MKKIICLILIISITASVFVGCTNAKPEYMHPYGEGIDPATVTTAPFQTRDPSDYTSPPTTTQTKKTLTTVPHGPLKVDIPEGHVLCPLCQGVLVVCDKCFGTTKMKAEILDERTGIYVRKYIDCTECAETPGYMKCELCENKLYIPE